MPLFKKHDNKQDQVADRHDNAADTQGAYGGNQPGRNATGVNPSRDYGAGEGGAGRHQQANVPGGGVGAGYDQQQQQRNTGAAGPGAGMGGAGPGAGNYENPNVPPTGNINQGQQGGGGRRFEGKVEHAVGSMVGSQALKNKGIQKEQEAGAFKAQSAEIAEAERLEQEALTRRERAVAHGAHPDNKHLGGIPGQQGGGNGGGGARTGGY